jgi:thiamine biosynthesis lipoprotein
VTHVEHVMGMAISIDIRDEVVPDGAVEEVVWWLHDVDAKFSTYKPESAVSRIAAGALAVDDAPALVQAVLTRCDELRAVTRGYFDARAGGVLDPSGYVKGWAIDHASWLLTEIGVQDHAINAGGDIRVHGPRRWRVGIAHPQVRDALCAVIELEGGAMATSGTAERGAHIIDPHTGRAALDLASVSVIGPDLATVDAYATAACAMGLDGPAWLESLTGDGIAAYVVDAGGYEWSTSNWAMIAGDERRGDSAVA